MKFTIDGRHMLPAQRKWWLLPNRLKLMVGGKRSGKTHMGALRAIRNSALNAGLPGMYVSPSLPIAKRTIIPTIKSFLRQADIEYRHYTQGEYGNAFYIENWDGHIWIGSGDTPESLVGSTLAWAGIDEPFLQKKAVFDEMLARISEPKAVQPELFMTGTPEELNWGYDVAMNDETRYDIGMVVASTRDNIFLPDDYVPTLEAAYSEEQVAAFIEGKFVNLYLGRVYKPFDRDIHLVTREKDDAEIMACIDFNVDFLTVELFYKGPTWVHFFDEIRLSNATTYDAAEALKIEHKGIVVFPDPAGGARATRSTDSDHDILRQAGFVVRSHRGHPPVRDRVNAVNRMLMDKRMTIEKGKCSWLVKDMERDSWRGGDVDKTSDKALTHAADAAGYAIEYLFPIISNQWSTESTW